MTDAGIHAVGAYAPDHRISADEIADAWGRFEASGIETTAVPDADEDAVTMAWAAATRALEAAGSDGPDLDFLAVATTTPPLEEEDLTARLGSLLGVPEDATRHVVTGSTRAGTRALALALDAAPERGLVVASDCPRGEPHDARGHAAGAGAAAFLVGPDAPVAVVDRAEHAQAYPGTRFRERGSDTLDGIDAGTYDRNAFVDPLAAAADRVDAGEVDAAAVQMPDGKLPYRAASALGVDTDAVAAPETVSTLGDTGAASVPLGMAKALDAGADRLLAAAWGSGAGADALVLERGGEVPTALALDGAESVNYGEYLRLRGEITAEEPDGGGAYVSVPTWHRSLPQRHRLVAGRCPDCGAYTFPPEGACRGCDSLVEYEEVALPGTGTVEAHTEIGKGGAPPEFAELQSRAGGFGVAIVAFDTPDDETATAPAMVVGEASVGDRVKAVQRRLYTQESVTRYGFKVRAVE
ncbi:zinc ribbon domain-containing protein [Halorarius halobius]|uniref:zinc ribbon domain-containing protein n=1 Tax=Halorarius halobius TaxID=2962671 RepID=UPI0020CDB4F9|nr:zinc ribbon domain-containing protein [Halorarius halobius]